MKKKHNHDYITEEDYTLQLAKSSRSAADPQLDSPGDSEADAGEEFEMGLNFSADELEREDDDEELSLSEEELDPEEIVSPQPKKHIDDLPESAKVVFSEQPSPWRDMEHTSDTN